MTVSTARRFQNLVDEISDGMSVHVDGVPNESAGAVVMGFYGLEGRIQLPNTEYYNEYTSNPVVREELAKRMAAKLWRAIEGEPLED